MRARLVTCVVALALLSTACSPGEAPGKQSASPTARRTSAAPTVSATPTPTKPVTSPQEYTRALQSVGKPLNAAMARLLSARSLTDLRKRATAANKLAGSSARRLEAQEPPPTEASEHSQLVKAVRTLQEEAGRVYNWSKSNGDCKAPSTASSLLASLDLADLAKATKALKGKGFDVGIRVPTSPKPIIRRLRNGQYVKPGSRTGSGSVSISNGSDSDAFVAFAKGKKQSFSVYIRKNNTFTIRGIRYGTYGGYFATGEDFDRKAKGFSRSCAFKKFDDPFKFPRGYRSSYQVTLYTVVGGNASTSDLGPGQFPD